MSLYAFVFTFVVFKIVNAIRPIRVSEEVERQGLDVPEFGMMAYPEDAGLELLAAGIGRSSSNEATTVGVMLYEMLTGKVPFTGPNAFVIMNDRLLNNPVPPREIDPAISPQLQEIIYRALEREPKNRYASGPRIRPRPRSIKSRSVCPIAPS